MKKTAISNLLRRAAALLLAAALSVPTVRAAAGEEKLRTSGDLVEGLTFHNTVTLNGTSRVESFALELSPDSDACPIVLQGGGTLYGAATVNKAVERAQALGYHVLGAINTDYFSTASGVPIGIVIEDGVYKSGPENESAILIAGGQLTLAEDPQVEMVLTNHRDGSQLQPNHFNKWRSSTGGVYLLNRHFSDVSTRTSTSGWYVRLELTEEEPYDGVPTQSGPIDEIPGWLLGDDAPEEGQEAPEDEAALPEEEASEEDRLGDETPEEPAAPADSEETSPEEDEDRRENDRDDREADEEALTEHGHELTVNSTLVLEVTEVLQSDQPLTIGANEYILTADDASSRLADFQSYQVGDLITLTTTCDDPTLSQAEWASGVGDVMIRDGSLTDSSQWLHVKDGRAPRGALGMKADGTLLLYAVDGRQSGYSMGLSQVDLAQELLRQGCQWAVNLDGGGSTAMSVWLPGQAGPAVQNRPSDGRPRGCATYLLLVTDQAGDGEPSRLAFKEDGLVVLTGSSVALPETVVLDDGLNLLEETPEELTILPEEGLGLVEAGIYTAGDRPGTDTLSLYDRRLRAEGAAQVHVVDTLTELTISLEGSDVPLTTLSIASGETAQLAVTGSYWGRTALRDFGGVTWTVEGNVGTIDENGLFTAAETWSGGSITATAGGLSQTIAISSPNVHLDVTEDHWSYESVSYCYRHGIVNGISTTEFGRDLQVRRGDFVLMLYNAAGKPAVTQACTFTDVTGRDYYHDALAWAQSGGLVSGNEDGGFAPTVPITREQAFTILHKVMPLLDKACPDGDLAVLEQFADKDDIAGYARPHIAALVSSGLVNGKGDGIDPAGTLTRAEMAALLHRLLTYVPGETEIPGEGETPDDPEAPEEGEDPAESGETSDPEGTGAAPQPGEGEGDPSLPEGSVFPAAPLPPMEEEEAGTPAQPEVPTLPEGPVLPDIPALPGQEQEPTLPEERPALPDASGYTLSLRHSDVTLSTGEQVVLTALLQPAYEGAEITWTSSAPASAAVSAGGVVTNVHPGLQATAVTITASWNGLSASCTIRCGAAALSGTVVDAENGLNIRSGPSREYGAVGLLADGTQVLILGVEGEWYRILYAGQDGLPAVGYVSGAYVAVHGGTTAP